MTVAPPSIEIRLATAADADAIWSLFQEVIAAGDAFAYDHRTTRADALHFWLASSTCCLVATSGPDILGTYYLRPNQPGRGAHVANAGYMVAAAARGRGIGRRLGEHSIAEARRLGFRAMQFNMVIATNEHAVRLWTELGFDIIGRSPRAFGHDTLGEVDALIMHRTLEESS